MCMLIHIFYFTYIHHTFIYVCLYTINIFYLDSHYILYRLYIHIVLSAIMSKERR